MERHTPTGCTNPSIGILLHALDDEIAEIPISRDRKSLLPGRLRCPGGVPRADVCQADAQQHLLWTPARLERLH
ncbi:hypothetical protein C1X54_38750, partial [Pseudomonas sp. GW460-13]